MNLGRPLRRYVPLLIAASVIPWLLISKLLVPWIIRQAYAGESLSLLNRLITAQERHPVEFYVSLWDQGTWPGVVSLLAVALATWVVMRFNLAEVWNRYWFRPAPLLDLAVVRIAVVGFELVNILSRHARVVAAGTYPDFKYDPLPVLRLLWPGSWFSIRPPIETVEVLIWVTVVFGLLGLVGFRTRLSLSFFAYGAVFRQAFLYSFGDHHHPEALLMMALPVLAFAPSGAALSVDSWMRRSRARGIGERAVREEKTSAEAGWPLRLVQWLFVLAYLSSALNKLGDSGFDWMNGYTLQYYLIRNGTRFGAELGIVLGQYHVPALLLSWVTMMFEATFVVPLLVPRLRWLYIPIGILLHVGIYLTLRAPFFQYLALYSVFIPWTLAMRPLWRNRSVI